MSNIDQHVPGYCPMGCGQTLFRARGGHITCSHLSCPNPAAVDDILLHDAEVEHIVEFREDVFTVRHPLRERLGDELMRCDLHSYLAALSGPPVQPGRYRMAWNPAGIGCWNVVGKVSA